MSDFIPPKAGGEVPVMATAPYPDARRALDASIAARAIGRPFPAGVCGECGGAIIWLEGVPWHSGSASFGERTWHEPGVSA